jgi:putative glutathione S-transferase
MGLLVEGEWKDVWYDTKPSKGQFVRAQSSFRSYVTAEAAAITSICLMPAPGHIAR